jgi:hypothetical protein
MAQQPQGNPLACLGNLDPELFKLIEETWKVTYSEQPGGLSRKYKFSLPWRLTLLTARRAASGRWQNRQCQPARPNRRSATL